MLIRLYKIRRTGPHKILRWVYTSTKFAYWSKHCLWNHGLQRYQVNQEDNSRKVTTCINWSHSWMWRAPGSIQANIQMFSEAISLQRTFVLCMFLCMFTVTNNGFRRCGLFYTLSIVNNQTLTIITKVDKRLCRVTYNPGRRFQEVILVSPMIRERVKETFPVVRLYQSSLYSKEIKESDW